MLLPLALVLALAPAASGSVELGPGTWRGLRTPSPAEAVVPAWAATRTVQVVSQPGGVLVRASWTLRSLSREAWFSGQVLGASPGLRVEQVTWNGKPVATATRQDGVFVAGRVSGRAVLEVLAFIPGEPTREPLTLTLLPAVRGHVEVQAPAGLIASLRTVGPPPPAAPTIVLNKTDTPVLTTPVPTHTTDAPVPTTPVPTHTTDAPVPTTPVPTHTTGTPVPADTTGTPDAPVPADTTGTPLAPAPDKTDTTLLPSVPADALRLGDVFWTGAGRLDLTYTTPPAAPGGRDDVVVARAGIGLTVGDAELRGRARLVWEVRQGSLDAVAFTATGTGADLDIKGIGVRAVQRTGDSVRVELQAPLAGRLELDLTWTAPLAKSAESRAALPQIAFTDVFRSESALQLARDGEVEAVPAATGWTPTTAAALPAWGQGLVEGTPTAAFRGGQSPGGHLDLLRFVPLEGPPVVVDVAAYTIATSREGRALIRAHYEVRNERAASLRVAPPPGFTMIGVRVGGATATPARDRDGAWRIPLQRSVETVSGLLSFPVEIALLGGSEPWDRRERRALPLPTLGAPVAVARVTLHLPPGYRSRLRPGDGEVVQAFTRGDGITYGLGVGAVGAAEADAVFQSAVKNWLSNDFDGAQRELDRLKALGASNENIARLQGNLDVIAGRGDKQDRGIQRRIREQAKARSITDQKLLDELRTRADESRKSGDYEAAQSQYQAAIEVGDRLAKLEQKESVEQSVSNMVLVDQLKSTAGEYDARKKRSKAGKQQTEAPAYRGGKGSYGPPVGSSSSTTPPPDRDGDGLVDGVDVDPGFETPVVPTDKITQAGDVTKTPRAAPAGRDFQSVVVTGKLAEDRGRVTSRQYDPPVAATTPENTYIVDGAAVAKPAPTKQAPVADPGSTASPSSGTLDSKYTVDGADVSSLTFGTVGAPIQDVTTATDTKDASGAMMGTEVSQDTYAAAPEAGRIVSLPGVARRAFRLRGRFKAGGANAPASDKPATPAPGPAAPGLEAKTKEAKQLAPEEGLPAPVVTASAVSVVVPQVGRAVLYQRLLLPADAAHAIDVSAREPLIAKD